MNGCLRTRVHKQPIIELYFELENEPKFYDLGDWSHYLLHFASACYGGWAMFLCVFSWCHVSASSQSLRFILSYEINSSIITSRPGLITYCILLLLCWLVNVLVCLLLVPYFGICL